MDARPLFAAVRSAAWPGEIRVRTYDTLAQYALAAGTEIGASAWLRIDQERIDRFAQATGDHQWIHVDPQRTRDELGMTTIAHGYLTLSLIPRFV